MPLNYLSGLTNIHEFIMDWSKFETPWSLTHSKIDVSDTFFPLFIVVFDVFDWPSLIFAAYSDPLSFLFSLLWFQVKSYEGKMEKMENQIDEQSSEIKDLREKVQTLMGKSEK